MAKQLAKIVTALLMLVAASVSSAAGIDWERVKGKHLTLFYPGQSSWEWLLTRHSAAKSVKKGTPCLECHLDEEPEMGDVLISGKKLEDHPVPSKQGSVDLDVKFARDQQRLYVRLAWKTPHWDPVAPMDRNKHATKVTVMFANDQVKEALVGGCWAFCHDDNTGMPSAKAEDKRELYLWGSRNKISRTGGGDDVKSAEQLKQLLEEGATLEYWQAQLNPGEPPIAVNGYVLDRRHELKQADLQVSARQEGDEWVVVLSRALNVATPGLKSFTADQSFTVGFAVHEHHAAGRFHYVSLGRRFGLESGSGRDFFAVSP